MPVGQQVTFDVEARRRRIFQALLALGLLGSVAGFAVNLFGPAPEFVVGAAGAIAFLVLASVTVLFGIGRLSNRTLGWGVLVAGALLTWTTLGYGLYLGDDAAAAEGVLTILHWVPVLYVFAFMVFDGPRAVWGAGALFSTVVLLTVPHAWFGLGASAGPLTPTYLVQVLLAHVVTLVALSFFATLQRGLAAWRDTAQEMHTLAHTDALTGLANRRAAQEVLVREVARAGRYQRELAVLMLDIDRFKVLNDTFGHPLGDRVLVALAERLRAHVRTSDLVARWGGEEFMVVAPETAMPFSQQLAELLRSHVAKDPFLDGHRVTVSIGVSSFREGDDVDALVARADAALYRAKEGGRNRVAVVDDLTDTDRERLGDPARAPS
jgi:diguanylate cyclase (GGDEF)-like protein